MNKKKILANLKNKFYINNIISNNITRLLIFLIAIFIILSIIKPDKFLSINNFQSMLAQFPEFGLLSLGITLVMITGGIDLSVVGIANLASIIAVKVLLKEEFQGLPESKMILVIILAIIAGIIVGFFCGLINGNLVSRFNIPPILTTLGSMQLFTGTAVILSGGRAITNLPILYPKIGSAVFFGVIPVSLIIFILAVIIFGYILRKTSYGLSIFMMGSNPIASKFSGLNNIKLLNITYISSGILASIAGLLMLARYSSARADYGSAYTLQSILIVILAGVNPAGGSGSITGLVLAILILQLLSTGINMFSSISSFYRQLIWGAVLIIIMIVNYFVSVRNKRGLVQ